MTSSCCGQPLEARHEYTQLRCVAAFGHDMHVLLVCVCLSAVNSCCRRAGRHTPVEQLCTRAVTRCHVLRALPHFAVMFLSYFLCTLLFCYVYSLCTAPLLLCSALLFAALLHAIVFCCCTNVRQALLSRLSTNGVAPITWVDINGSPVAIGSGGASSNAM